jgi:pimeloyl-ACP methyl ester carboxylesterase
MRLAGLPVIAPDFRGMNLAARVDHLLELLDARDPADAPVVVGSSYGGLTALCAGVRFAERGGEIAAMVLCAPVIARAESPATELELAPVAPTVIIHGTGDDVVPIDTSRDFARAHDGVELHEVDDGHRLDASLDLIVDTVRRFAGAPAASPG